jgi:hypothetical protein
LVSFTRSMCPATCAYATCFLCRALFQTPLPVNMAIRSQPRLGAEPEGVRARYYSASSIRMRRRRKPRPLLSIFVTAMRPIIAVEAT